MAELCTPFGVYTIKMYSGLWGDPPRNASVEDTFRYAPMGGGGGWPGDFVSKAVC